jgi:serine protease Do
MVNKLYNATAKYLPEIALFLLTLCLAGCSGCSKSGIRSHSREAGKSAELNQEPSVESDNPETVTEKDPETEQNTSGNLPLNELFRKCKPAVFMIKTIDEGNQYQGTGFFISPGGIAISNYHLFEGKTMGKEEIKLADGSQTTIKDFLARNSEEDYIIFQVEVNNPVQYLSVSSVEPEIGEEVFAIGNPHGLEHTLSQGIVSGYRQEKMLIQTTAEIAQGSSGGPLMNLQGEVVGITSSTLGEANLNFAVNINLLYLSRFLQEE